MNPLVSDDSGSVMCVSSGLDIYFKLRETAID